MKIKQPAVCVKQKGAGGHIGITPTYLIIHFLCAVDVLAVEVVAAMTHSGDKLRKKRASRMSNILKLYQPPPDTHTNTSTHTQT